jgi:hypothetical protein
VSRGRGFLLVVAAAAIAGIAAGAWVFGLLTAPAA